MASSLTGDAVADAFLSGAPEPAAAPEAPVTTGDPVADRFIASDAPPSNVEPTTGGKVKRGIFGIPYIDPASVPTPKRVMPMGADSAMGVVADKALQAATGLPLEATAGLVGLASWPFGTDTAARNISKVTNLIPRANTDPRLQGPAAAAVQEGIESPLNVLNLPGNVGKASAWLAEKAGVPETIAQPTGRAISDVGGLLLGARGAREIPGAENTAGEAEAVPSDFGFSNKSGGAAAAEEDLSALSPETQAAVAHARTVGPVNSEVLAAHREAETLPLPAGESPIRLTAGRATGDAQQFSDERNLRGDPATQGILSNLEAENNRKLVASLDEIRGNAVPDVVQRNNLEHGQAAINVLKEQDNNAVLDIRAKYKALADANGGAIPIDTGQAITGIDAALKKGYLTKTAQDNGVVSSVMDDLRSGQPIDFESFENARTRLAEVQRGGGSDAAAAGIVRNALEAMPLPKEAAPLKGLADTAREAAKARFDAIRNNPAYEAVVNDNVPKVNGLHNLDAPSPLADTFMQRYVTGNGAGASRANILNLRALTNDHPDFMNAIEGATLNNLRSAAGVSDQGGGFNAASYNRARTALEPKIDALVQPETAQVTQQLGNVARRLNEQPKGSFVNNSATAIAAQRMQAQEQGSGFGADIAHMGLNAATGALGPAGGIASAAVSAAMRGRALRRAQAFEAEVNAEKLNFAQEATAPGAGLNYRAPR